MPSILPPWVWIPCTPSKLSSIHIDSYVMSKKTKINKKRPGLAHLKKLFSLHFIVVSSTSVRSFVRFKSFLRCDRIRFRLKRISNTPVHSRSFGTKGKLVGALFNGFQFVSTKMGFWMIDQTKLTYFVWQRSADLLFDCFGCSSFVKLRLSLDCLNPIQSTRLVDTSPYEVTVYSLSLFCLDKSPLPH